MYSNALYTAVAACALLASSVNAHMVITSPVPYGQDSLSNAPLEPDGSDFPCKQRDGVYDMGTMNEMKVGMPQTLSFKGGASHGGGSCQLSVTMDEKPDKNSKWKVIHSIIGSCPNGAAGNADGSPNYNGNPTFEYTMPKGMPNGKYTMAWTWFNKIGNREMYMNCAPIHVSGGADNNDVLDTLPDMFVANIGNGCEVCENQDFVFPQCGLNVETAAKTALGSSTIGSCPTGAAGSGSGSGGSGSGPASSPAAPTAPAASSADAAAPTGAAPPAAPSSVPDAAPSGYGSPAGAAAPSYDDGSYKPSGVSGSAPSSAAAQAPAPTAYGGSPGGAEAGGMQIKTDVVMYTQWATVTAEGPAPSGYTPPNANPGPPAGGPPPSHGSGPAAGGPAAGGPAAGGPAAGGSPGYSPPASKGKAAGTDSNDTSKGCAGDAVPCEGEDSVVCMDGGKFGLCNHGCAVPRALADGTHCANGKVARRDNAKRHALRHRSHGHRF
jgi:hypothetical protein